MSDLPVRDEQYVSQLQRYPTPKASLTFVRLVIASFIGIGVALVIVPWWQTAAGKGQTIALNPEERIQEVHSLISGRVEKWLVQEGERVEKGQAIVQIVDNDPNLMERLQSELDATKQKVKAAQTAVQASYSNLERQKSLYSEGLSSKLDLEKAEIRWTQLQTSLASAEADLAKVNTKVARYGEQIVRAPKSGLISRILLGAGPVRVAEGDRLAVLIPDFEQLGAEIYVDGNDLPLISPGSQVRVQFEGWPAIQFSGWPQLSSGTFCAEVIAVDSVASAEGRFRVLLKPGSKDGWDQLVNLRQQTRVKAWVMLGQVSLGYELWRRFNGFPVERPVEDSSLYNKKRKLTK